MSSAGAGTGTGPPGPEPRPPEPRRFRQRIPRPPAARRPAVARARFVEVATRLGPDELAARLGRADLLERAFGPIVGGGLPGAGAPSAAAARIGAAVLLPVIGGRSPDDPARLVLIRRATHLRANPGEIAFAGGRLEPGESPRQAALREAEEELLLERHHVRVLGSLPTVFRRSRAERIEPFVATVEGVVRLVPSPGEVDDVLVLALGDLARPERYFEEEWPMPGGGRRMMHFFELESDILWGASAAILTLLLDRLAVAAGGP